MLVSRTQRPFHVRLVVRRVHGSTVQFTCHAVSECFPILVVGIICVEADNVFLKCVLWVSGADIGAWRVWDMLKAEHCLQAGEEESRGD